MLWNRPFSRLSDLCDVTLTLDRVIRHIPSFITCRRLSHRSIIRNTWSIYLSNFVEIGKIFCWPTHGRWHRLYRFHVKESLLITRVCLTAMITATSMRAIIIIITQPLSFWRVRFACLQATSVVNRPDACANRANQCLLTLTLLVLSSPTIISATVVHDVSQAYLYM